jgi:hypothetical protein
MVSGGDALIQVRTASAGDVRVSIGDRDVTSAFATGATPNVRTGLVEGLTVGKNVLRVVVSGASAQLELTNYSIAGPIVSGAHQTPFICTTQESGLGAPLDANCAAQTKFDYFYKARGFGGGDFKPLPDPKTIPNDVAEATTRDGRKVPYIVRVESGTIDRAIYRIAILDDPRQATNPWKPGAGWNGRLVYSFGGGCGVNYNQGRNTPQTVLSDDFLSRGFAHVTSTANVLGQFCNDHLSGEAAMMIKEHFIERYGVPAWTVGFGGSGGSMQQQLIAQNFPGILDGLLPSLSFPDMFTIWNAIHDCKLMSAYFATHPGWSDEKKQAVVGASLGTCRAGEPYLVSDSASNARSCGIAPNLVYDPQKNPTGARCTVWDTNVNTFGRDPMTGAARRTYDNVGLQYGLEALLAGKITPAEFVDLNTGIGGFDNDGNARRERSSADPDALRHAYAAGRVNQGGGALGSIPILHYRAYLDDQDNVHDRFRELQIRDRLKRATGRTDNDVAWLAAPGPMQQVVTELALDTMARWLDTLKSDTSKDPEIVKVIRAKPSRAVDACWDKDATRLDEPFSMDPSSRCNKLFPPHTNIHIAAGAPLSDDILKCQLKPLSRGDYKKGAFTDAQWTALTAAFPGGVCDYAKPGVGYGKVTGTYQALPLAPTTNTSSR